MFSRVSRRLSSVVSFLLPLLTLTLTTACGSSYETIKVKNYKFAVLNDNGKYKDTFRQLIADYNSLSGFDAMELVDSADDANSAIVITNGLEDKSGKVGWGQMLSSSKSDSPVSMPGQHPKRVVSYAMRVEFDEKYILDNSDFSDEKKHTNAQKLFFHESGHGLEMGHDMHDQRNVMYYNIAGDKDFNSYFERVRAYLNDQG